MPLARVWTGVGTFFIPLAITWAVFVRNGLPSEIHEIGVVVSRAYWGLLATLLAGGTLTWTCAMYVQRARAAHARILVPPNTNFEKPHERNRKISWITAAVFSAAILAAVLLFGNDYSKSVIYCCETRERQFLRAFGRADRLPMRRGAPAASNNRASLSRRGSTADPNLFSTASMNT